MKIQSDTILETHALEIGYSYTSNTLNGTRAELERRAIEIGEKRKRAWQTPHHPTRTSF